MALNGFDVQVLPVKTGEMDLKERRILSADEGYQEFQKKLGFQPKSFFFQYQTMGFRTRENVNYIYILHIYIYNTSVSSKKTLVNAHLGDFCFLSGFSPHERNCTTFGIFALCVCEAKITSIFSWEILVR